MISGRKMSIIHQNNVILVREANEKGLYHLISHVPEEKGAYGAIRDIPKSNAL